MAVKDELLEKAMDLPPEEREELADELLGSVEGEERTDRSRAAHGARGPRRRGAMEELLQKALDLSPEDRAELAYELLDSDEGEEAPESIEEEWEDELLRRLDGLRSGRVKGVDGFEMLRQAKAGLEERIRKARDGSR